MGLFGRGVQDQFIGKVGNVIGSTWKGEAVMRATPIRKKSRSFSQAQLEQQAKFALAINVLQNLAPLYNVTLRRYAKKQSGFNVALSDALEQAITGTYPGYGIDYSKLIMSKGNLPNVKELQVTATAAKTVLFNWDEEAIPITALGSDRSILVAYCPELNQFEYTWAGPARMMGIAQLDTRDFTGKEVHLWVGFISDNGQRASDSRYMGTVTVL